MAQPDLFRIPRKPWNAGRLIGPKAPLKPKHICWSARRLFQAMSIPFRSVDLDSVAYQEGDLGGRIRSALQARTRISTIPQIFIGGAFVGGASDVIAAAARGDLQGSLSAAEVPHTVPEGLDPLTFLPQWLTRPAT